MTDFFQLFRFLMALGAGIAVVEVLALLFWLPIYYRRGIRLHRHEVFGALPPDRSLMGILACSNTGFRFRNISAQEVAFRDPLVSFRFKPAPIIHGLIRYDGSKVEIQGLANWTAMYAVLLFSILGASWIVLMGFSGLIGLFVIGLLLICWVFSYQSQRQRLDDLADELTANLPVKRSDIKVAQPT